MVLTVLIGTSLVIALAGLCAAGISHCIAFGNDNDAPSHIVRQDRKPIAYRRLQ